MELHEIASHRNLVEFFVSQDLEVEGLGTIYSSLGIKYLSDSIFWCELSGVGARIGIGPFHTEIVFPLSRDDLLEELRKLISDYFERKL